MAPDRSAFDTETTGSRDDCIHKVVQGILARCSQGETFSAAAIAADHPELMPEFSEALRKLRMVMRGEKDSTEKGAEQRTAEVSEIEPPRQAGHYELRTCLGIGTFAKFGRCTTGSWTGTLP